MLEFLLQAGANALGTVASGVILGGVAVRVGLLDVDQEALELAEDFSALTGIALLLVCGVAVLAIVMLRFIEPERRRHHDGVVLRLLEGAAVVGIIVTTVNFAASMLIWWDPEMLVAWVFLVALFVAAILVLRALRRRVLAST